MSIEKIKEALDEFVDLRSACHMPRGSEMPNMLGKSLSSAVEIGWDVLGTIPGRLTLKDLEHWRAFGSPNEPTLLEWAGPIVERLHELVRFGNQKHRQSFKAYIAVSHHPLINTPDLDLNQMTNVTFTVRLKTPNNIWLTDVTLIIYHGGNGNMLLRITDTYGNGVWPASFIVKG